MKEEGEQKRTVLAENLDHDPAFPASKHPLVPTLASFAASATPPIFGSMDERTGVVRSDRERD